MTKQDINDILSGCRSGNSASQERLYRMFYAYGITIVLHYNNDLEEAKGIYNDAMFKALTNVHQYRQEASFKSWFRRILINCIIDYNRRFKDSIQFVDAILADDVSLEASVELKLENEDILAIVQQITVSYRTVFLLHSIEGYKFNEIAEQLNITEGGAKTLYHKAKIKLQFLLKDYYADERKKIY